MVRSQRLTALAAVLATRQIEAEHYLTVESTPAKMSFIENNVLQQENSKAMKEEDRTPS